MPDKIIVEKTEPANPQAERPRFNRSVVRVVRLEQEPDGDKVVTVLYKSGRQGPRISGKYRGVHKRFVRLMEGHDTFIDEYKKRHHQSNARKKDGWLKDFRKNVSRAFRAGRKRAKVSFGFD